MRKVLVWARSSSSFSMASADSPPSAGATYLGARGAQEWKAWGPATDPSSILTGTYRAGARDQGGPHRCRSVPAGG